MESLFCDYDSLTADYEEAVTATVLEVQDTKVNSVAEGYEYTEITFLAKVTSGGYKGNEVRMPQTIDKMV